MAYPLRFLKGSSDPTHALLPDDDLQFFLPPTSGVQNGKPVFSWAQAAVQITRESGGWGAGAVVTYAFRADSGTMPSGTSGFSQFTSAQIQAAETALQLWSAVANITFQRVGSGTTGPGAYSNSATILFGNYASGLDGASAFAFYPGGSAVAGDIWVNSSLASNSELAIGQFGMHTLTHEIGHAIGLAHPGNYDATDGVDPTYETNAVYWQDARMFTVMSYFGSANTGGSLNAFAAGPQLHDIAAAQLLYGPNPNARSGDTVYGFNSNTGLGHYTITADGQSPVFSIWDTGGTDTINFSGYTTATEIDLRAESFSSAGPGNGGTGVAIGNISIARGVVIENAIGGSGADLMTGNSVANNMQGGAGNDIIDGGDGNDTLSGGAGSDTITGGNGNDTLYGYAAGGGSAITSTVAASGLNQPVAGASTAADPGFLYIMEKGTGIIWRLDPSTGAKTVFLDIPNTEFASDGERGALGLAFHPDYATNGRFFVFLTDPQGDLVVREYSRSGNPAVANTSFTQIIEIPKQTGFSNHNGGWIGFSPTDGCLYIATGDGGSGGDPSNNAQNINSPLGKILRIDVNTDGFPGDATRNYAIPGANPFVGVDGLDEIWAFGVRNPWRIAFDPRNGDLYIADVGQGAYEEVDYHAAGAAAGANYGWRIMEGAHSYNPGPPGTPQPGDPSLVLPVYEYGRTLGASITGGEIYTGASSFAGQYVFADFVSGRLFSLSVLNGVSTDATDRTAQIVGAAPSSVTDFVTGTNGQLYAIGIGGTVWMLQFANGAEDGADVIRGGAGNDMIDGGAGVDQLFGDDGDDTIFYDALDDLANVLGGAGVDALVFTSGVAPNSFNLVSHGFETAEGRFVDTGANPWATRTDLYDNQWRLDFRTVINDNGTRELTDYDQGNSVNWSSFLTRQDALGRATETVLTYDTGVTDTTNLDPDNAFFWSSFVTRRDALGRTTESLLIHDNGVRDTTNYDADNSFFWSSFVTRRDSLGRTTESLLIHDDGTRDTTNYDPENAVFWSSFVTRRDALGRTTESLLIHDDGTRDTTNYDPENAVFWSSFVTRRDSLGRTTDTLLIYDDGRRDSTDYDEANVHDWANVVYRYDAGGVLQQTIITYDNGSIVII